MLWVVLPGDEEAVPKIAPGEYAKVTRALAQRIVRRWGSGKLPRPGWEQRLDVPAARMFLVNAAGKFEVRNYGAASNAPEEGTMRQNAPPLMIKSLAELRQALAKPSQYYHSEYYVTKDGGILSPKTVEAEWERITEAFRDRSPDDDQWLVIAREINYEDDGLYDDHTGNAIPPAYPNNPQAGSPGRVGPGRIASSLVPAVPGSTPHGNPPLHSVRAVGSNMTEVEHGDLTILYSYKTPVLFHDREYGGFFITEQRHSTTTSKHIGKYLREEWGQDAAAIKAMERIPQAEIEAAAKAGTHWARHGENPDGYSPGARGFIGAEISRLMRDKGYDQQRAVAAAHDIARRKRYKVPPRPNVYEEEEDCEQYFLVLVDNTYGIYQGQELVARGIEWKGVQDDTLSILEAGPDHEHYMEAWDEMMADATFEQGGHEWRLIAGPSGDILAYADDTPDGCLEGW